MVTTPEDASADMAHLMLELREHLARHHPGSVYVAFCDEWLEYLRRHPGDPQVVREVRRDLAPGGDLFRLEAPEGEPRFAELRRSLWQRVRSVPQVTDWWPMPPDPTDPMAARLRARLRDAS